MLWILSFPLTIIVLKLLPTSELHTFTIYCLLYTSPVHVCFAWLLVFLVLLLSRPLGRRTKFNDVQFHYFFGIKNKYIHGSYNFNAERARRLHGKCKCGMHVTYMHLRFPTDACDDFCFIRFKIKRPTSYGNIFMQFQHSVSTIDKDIMKIEYTLDYKISLTVLFYHFCVTPILISFLRTFLNGVSMFEK